MPKVEVYDTVALKANRHLIGVVERTQNENHDPLQDILIIAHADVDHSALTEFVTTGVPPKGHVFVSFADEGQGSSLVHEDDLILLDRNFNLGDVVKKGGSQMLGTVVSVAEKYSVCPLWSNTYNLAVGPSNPVPLEELDQSNSHVCSSDCPQPTLDDVEFPSTQHLIHNVPGEELKRAEDLLEADYVMQDDWLGIVEKLDLVVIIMLEDDSIVAVRDPEELYIPVPDSGKPLVSLPEFDELARPDPLVAQQGWSATIPPNDFRCGQLVVTNHRNIRQGRWLRGQFSASVKPQGRVLDVRTRAAEVRWIACNSFIPEDPFSIDRPASHINLYENIDRFPKRSELRLNKKLSIYDHGRLPRVTESRTRAPESRSSPAPQAHVPNEFRVGDQVKFRDPAGAAVKYQGVKSNDGIVHSRFDRVSSASMFGFDVNELKIVFSQQDATILWQDGSSGCYLSKTLSKFPLFETELAPSDLVVAREGMKQTPECLGPKMFDTPSDFNEMKFFEKPHDLLPEKVGIVQSVNPEERLARVRWFLDPRPKLRLASYGHVLNGYSRFGKLSEMVEDVSLYEIMTFPALMRRLKDLVIIPPITVSEKAVNIGLQLSGRSLTGIGQASISQINAYSTGDLLSWLQDAAWAATHDLVPSQTIDTAHYQMHHSLDWVGEIVRLGLDGTITVRLNSGDVCKDVLIEHDQIICLIDDGAINGVDFTPQGHDMMDIDASFSDGGSYDIDTASTISETVEYEGGERLDDDSGDENWEDAEDDSIEKEAVPLVSDLKYGPSTHTAGSEMSPQVTTDESLLGARPSSDAKLTISPTNDFLPSLMSSLPASEPPMFAVLDCEPPVNQFRDTKQSLVDSPAFLKRMAREHRILSSSLPKNEIYVRTFENRLDLMRCLIIGPVDTPYEHAPFLIDLQMGKNFPREPPVAHFHSWTSGLGRINPNLYEEGKICLSLLGTWPGKAETESWSEKATILQLLVSLQGLVFVRQPFYNEAGFEGYAEDKAYSLEAQRYNEKAYVMARGFVRHAVAAPVQGLEDVLAWQYLPHDSSPGLLSQVAARAQRLMGSSEQRNGSDDLLDGEGSNDNQTKVFLRPLSQGAVVMLKKTIQLLENLMAAFRGEVTPGTTE